jgi:predicted ribosome quality control (RQC) complex YloA/Tae2 family protein
MTFDGLIVAAVVSELRRWLIGGRVQHVRQHNQTDLTLEIRVPGRTHLLYLSADARFPRAHLTSSAKPVPPQPPHFCMTLRKHLEGSTLTNIEQVGFDRILRFQFNRIGQGARVLILEIMGKHSNVILTDELGRIIAAAKHIGASVSRYRQILPGRTYIPPPHSSKIDLTSPDAEQQIKQVVKQISRSPLDAQTVQSWLVETLSGFGPFLANEVVLRSVSGGTVVPELLENELTLLRNKVLTENYEISLITSETGQALMAYPITTVQFPPEQQHKRSSINSALDTVYRSLVARAELEDLRKEVLTAIRQEIDFRKRSLESLDRTLAESARADQYRQIGELILAHLHTIEKGSSSAKLINYFDPSMSELEVELDEKLTPQENAQQYFKRYQKLRDAAANAEERRRKIDLELSQLTEAIERAQFAVSVDELQKLRDSLSNQGILRVRTPKSEPEDELASHQVKRILTDEGWEILYGETAQGNDYLTQKLARPNDIWLHARSVKGAHVLVRTAGKAGGVPKQVLLRAATIAAANSEAKHSRLVPVDYTHAKYVRKPRGAAPGFVVYKNEKTIDVCPGEEQ